MLFSFPYFKSSKAKLPKDAHLTSAFIERAWGHLFDQTQRSVLCALTKRGDPFPIWAGRTHAEHRGLSGCKAGFSSSLHPRFLPPWLQAGGAQQIVFELCSPAEIKSGKAREFTPPRMGGFKEVSSELTLSGVLTGRDGEGSSRGSKQVRRTRRAVSRVTVPRREQRNMKLVTGRWIDWLIVFYYYFSFIRSFIHSILYI